MTRAAANVLGLAAAASAALFPTVAPGAALRRGLTLTGVTGTADIQGSGLLRGTLGSGSVWVSDDTGEFEIDNAHECVDENGGESCRGQQLRFRLLVRGPFSVRLEGSRLDLTALGRGSASLDAAGSYTLDGRARRRLPQRVFNATF